MTAAVALDERGGRVETWLRWASDPRVLGTILAVVGLPLRSTRAQSLFGGPDVSWQFGVSLAHTEGLHFGRDLVFTYGPLSFLSVPNDVYLLGAVLGVLYLLLAGAAFYYLFVRWLAELVPPVAVIAIAVVCMVVWSGVVNGTPEMVVAAAALGGLWALHPERRAAGMAAWIAPTLGVAGRAADAREVQHRPRVPRSRRPGGGVGQPSARTGVGGAGIVRRRSRGAVAGQRPGPR